MLIVLVRPGAKSLQRRRSYTDMVTIYKCLHSEMNCTPADIGLSVVTSNSRGKDIRLVQQNASNAMCAAHFKCRAASQWNKLPFNIVNCKSLLTFKRLLKKFLDN